MGRGRQKAKQTKVARQLKYYSPETDYEALERELAGSSSVEPERDSTDLDDDGLTAYERWVASQNGHA